MSSAEAPSSQAVQAMLDVAEQHFCALVKDGCSENVACSRTWDAYVHAFDDSEDHCFDQRDRAAEAEMRNMRERY